MTSLIETDSQFAKDVYEGLSAEQKYLSSRYFYDAKGDKLFQQIMAMPEYYLTNCEFEIFNTHKSALLNSFYSSKKFHLVELGAGDGYKTKVLLRHFTEQKVEFDYAPVDISSDVLVELESSLKAEIPNLKLNVLNHEYFDALKELNHLDDSPKVILFLGSNIGNFTPERASAFFSQLHQIMNSGDKLLIGVDLKKKPSTILNAYNDKQGITKAFNLNLLERMNRELGADFDLDNWDHYPTYDPFSGECRSYLMSSVKQEVHFKALNTTFNFEHSEPIHMEISKKYSLRDIEKLASETGFRVQQHFTDSKDYFVDTLWEKP